jgi:hypothetical protein
MSDAQTAHWAKHAAAEGARVSADPGESGDIAPPPPEVPDGAEPQPEMVAPDLGDQPEMPNAGMTDLA